MKTSKARSAFAAIAALCLFAFTARAADPAVNYWSFVVGNSCTAKVQAGDTTVSEVLTVTKVTPPGADGMSEATVEYTIDGKVVQVEIYHFNDKGIWRTAAGATGTDTLTPPIPLVQYPMTPGKKWMWKGTIHTAKGDIEGSSELSTPGPEPLKIAAGEFQAVHVHSELVLNIGTQKMTVPNDYWFAPAVGMVKQYMKMGDLVITAEATSYKVK